MTMTILSVTLGLTLLITPMLAMQPKEVLEKHLKKWMMDDDVVWGRFAEQKKRLWTSYQNQLVDEFKRIYLTDLQNLPTEQQEQELTNAEQALRIELKDMFLSESLPTETDMKNAVLRTYNATEHGANFETYGDFWMEKDVSLMSLRIMGVIEHYKSFHDVINDKSAGECTISANDRLDYLHQNIWEYNIDAAFTDFDITILGCNQKYNYVQYHMSLLDSDDSGRNEAQRLKVHESLGGFATACDTAKTALDKIHFWVSFYDAVENVRNLDEFKWHDIFENDQFEEFHERSQDEKSIGQKEEEYKNQLLLQENAREALSK